MKPGGGGIPMTGTAQLDGIPSHGFAVPAPFRKGAFSLLYVLSKNNKNILTNSFRRARMGASERRDYPWKRLLSSAWQRFCG